MSIQAARGSSERVRPICFCMSDADIEKAKITARNHRKSLSEYVRDLVIAAGLDTDVE